MFLFKIGNNKNDKVPKNTVKTVCEIQTNHPKAVPAVSEIPYKRKISAINNGKAPKPLLVNPIAKLPITKPINAVVMLIVLVSLSAKMVI